MTAKEREALRDRISELLEERDLSDLLEEFDISADYAFLLLYESGHLDPEIFNNLTGNY